MCIFSHLREHRFPPVALIGVDKERLTSSSSSDCSDCWSVHKIKLGWKKNCTPLVLVCLVLTLPLGALSQWIDEGEFSQAMLAHKLCLLKGGFELVEAELLMRRGAESKINELQRVYAKIKRLEAEFQRGRYYPDLLDERIVIIREELRLILADGDQMRVDQKRS